VIPSRLRRQKKFAVSSDGAWPRRTSSWPLAVACKKFRQQEETTMTKRIGNKDEAQLRGKEEKKDIKRTNLAREAVKKAIAKSTYRNQVKNQPSPT
jgi:hypothetical protein